VGVASGGVGLAGGRVVVGDAGAALVAVGLAATVVAVGVCGAVVGVGDGVERVSESPQPATALLSRPAMANDTNQLLPRLQLLRLMCASLRRVTLRWAPRSICAWMLIDPRTRCCQAARGRSARCGRRGSRGSMRPLAAAGA